MHNVICTWYMWDFVCCCASVVCKSCVCTHARTQCVHTCSYEAHAQEHKVCHFISFHAVYLAK